MRRTPGSFERVCVLMAMEAEARPLIGALGARAVEGGLGAPLPMRVYEAVVGSGRVDLIVNGRDPRFGVDLIGTQPAVLAAQCAIERFRPTLLISAGTAGGFDVRGARIGDVYVSRDRVVFHDRRIALGAFHEYGIGSYPCVDASAMARELGLKTGIVTTGNALDLPACDLAMLRETGGEVKEMEAAAVAWVASLHGVGFMAVKAITDLVDGEHPTGVEFERNLECASEALTGALVRVLRWVVGGEAMTAPGTEPGV